MGTGILKRALFALALAYSLSILVARWGTPLNTPHAFRETQTAMTVYWMLQGDDHVSSLQRPVDGLDLNHHATRSGARGYLDALSSWIAYQTPVMGPPWQVPFEFPTFQWIVAGVTYATKLDLDNAGRLVSWAFLVGAFLPLWKLASRQNIDPYILGTLLLCSPIYLYWGTAFLIETCSLFLCLMFLWMMEEKRWVLGLILGCLAAVTKLPTLIPFLGLSVIVARERARPLLLGAIALGAGVMWTHYTDLLKAQNPLSSVLMSSQPRQILHDWGTLTERFSWEPWQTLWRNIQHIL